MRISTNTIYQNGISRISALQSQQARLQQQISTGKRILSPSDDPVAAARALELKHAQSVNTQYQDNGKSAQNKLTQVEFTLAGLSELLVATKTTLVSAGNGALSDTERKFIASELSGTLQQLVGIANSKNSNGEYIFAGFKTDTAAFTQTSTGATYNGDGNQQLLQVAAGRQMEVSETGSNIFQANGNDVFKTLNDLIALLNTPVVTQADADALKAGLISNDTKLETSLNNVLSIRSSVGSRLKELDGLDLAGKDRDLQYTQALSDAQDLDYAQALSDLTKQQTILEAAQKSFVSTVGLSLFNLIGG